MTWWEVEQMTFYVNTLQEKLDQWRLSNPKMRIEQQKVSRLADKIEEALPDTSDAEKRDFLYHLAGRIEELQQHLTERLKREVSRNVSPRNLL